jgi:oligopeptide/dipeptide ABC transporter ATP-binding protein
MMNSNIPNSTDLTCALKVDDLHVDFATAGGVLPAVRGVSFELEQGETLAIVGESGSGKSVTALSIMQLIAKRTGRISSGEIVFDGQDLLQLDEHKLREMRGNAISMIFQEPMSSLNPLMKVGHQVGEVFRRHLKVDRAEAKRLSIEMLRKVGLSAPERRYNEFPHQISGGMRQRVMIAIALACRPQLLIADEPTTALDVTIQGQILDLIEDLKNENEMSVIIITHDLGVVAEIVDYVVVMYAGQVVETGYAREIFEQPRHPYTKALINAVPKLGLRTRTKQRTRLEEIVGTVPNLLALPAGCAFCERCDYAQEICSTLAPSMEVVGARRSVRCHFDLTKKDRHHER